MTCDYGIQLLSLRGIPSDFGLVALEVIVRTPRLLSTVRHKYASDPFPVQAARGVTVHWKQARSAKAYVRLRLLLGDAPAEAAATAAATSAAAVMPASTASASAEGSAAARGFCKSAEAPLQLSGAQGQQATQMHLALPLEADAGFGERSGVGAPFLQGAAVDLDLIVLAGKSGGGSDAAAAGSVAAGAAVSAPVTSNGTHAPQAWAWAEFVSAPAASPTPPDVAMRPAAPRKRSWLLALGLGRHGGGSAGGAAATAATSAGGAAGSDPSYRKGAAAAALAKVSSQATSAWDPVAALSSVTNTTATSAATAATAATAVASLSSSSLGGPGSMQAAPYQDPGGECGPRAALLPPPPGRRRLPPQPPLLLPPSPFAPLSLAAAPTVPSDTATFVGAAASTASPPQQQPQQQPQQAAVIATAPSGCSEPQAPKRRRLGDFFARLFHPSSSNNQVRRIGGDEASSPSVGPTSSPSTAAALALAPAGGIRAASAATLPRTSVDGDGAGGASAAAAAPTPTAGGLGPGKPQLRRNGSPLGVTPLTPPSPRLGDVYRLQDNAMASDTAVHIGFSLGAADVAAAGGVARPSSVLLRGLESPGYGETSPAGGPDRLGTEPPVDDMAAASLASPMASSPDTPVGGCFFWRYGAAARARASQQAAGPAPPPPPPPAAGNAVLGRAGSAPVPGVSPSLACPAGLQGNAGRQLNTLSVTDALQTALSSSAPARTSADWAAQGSAAAGGQQQQAACDQVQGAAQDRAKAAAAAAQGTWSHPLEGEIVRVMEFVSGQKGLSEDLRAVALSQCQFLLDCLRNPDMCWLAGDSLLQLKHEVGFPFDTGVPIAGAPGWFRLVLQPLNAPPPTPGDADSAAVSAAAGVASSLPQPEVLKVRWACIDQRQVGGTNACAAIGLEVASWCLGAIQRWRRTVAAAASGSPGGGGGRRDAAIWPQPNSNAESTAAANASGGAAAAGAACRREVLPRLSRSQRDRDRERLAASVALEAISGDALEQCIRAGTAVWQAVLLQSPATRVASSTGDFDLEHMLQLGGYGEKLRLAEYLAASLLEDGGSCGNCGGGAAGGSGGGTSAAAPRRCSREGGAGGDAAIAAAAAAAAAAATSAQPHSAALAAAAATSLIFPSLPERPARPEREPAGRPGRPPALQLALAGDALQPHGSDVVIIDAPPPASSRPRRGSQSGLPSFAALVRSLQPGVYVLGWHGHFATLWLRPGGVVHLIDSLGARLAADCPLAFVLEFDAPSDFLAFFLARHLARRDAAAADDIAGANMAALIEVHRLELLKPPQ